MEIELNGIRRKVTIIGGFKLKDNNYAVCSYQDDEGIYKIVILQVVKDSAEMHVINIPEEDREEVLRAYEQVKGYIMEEDYE